MDRRMLRIVVGVTVWAVAGWGWSDEGKAVVLRLGNGRFLRAETEGTLRADRFVPGQEETFQLVTREKDSFALKAANGRFLVTEDRDARKIRADSPRSEPAERETFVLVRGDNQTTGLKTRGYLEFVVADPQQNQQKASPVRVVPGNPRPEEVVELYDVSQMSEGVLDNLAEMISGQMTSELAGQKYETVAAWKQEKFIDLPWSMTSDQKKRFQLLGLEEQFRLEARLNGSPQVRMTHMPYLKEHSRPKAGALLFQVEAEIPVTGQVGAKVPNAVDAKINFRTRIGIRVAGEFGTEKKDEGVELRPPRIRDVQVEMRELTPFQRPVAGLSSPDQGPDQSRTPQEPRPDPRRGRPVASRCD